MDYKRPKSAKERSLSLNDRINELRSHYLFTDHATNPNTMDSLKMETTSSSGIKKDDRVQEMKNLHHINSLNKDRNVEDHESQIRRLRKLIEEHTQSTPNRTRDSDSSIWRLTSEPNSDELQQTEQSEQTTNALESRKEIGSKKEIDSKMQRINNLLISQKEKVSKTVKTPVDSMKMKKKEKSAMFTDPEKHKIGKNNPHFHAKSLREKDDQIRILNEKLDQQQSVINEMNKRRDLDNAQIQRLRTLLNEQKESQKCAEDKLKKLLIEEKNTSVKVIENCEMEIQQMMDMIQQQRIESDKLKKESVCSTAEIKRLREKVYSKEKVITQMKEGHHTAIRKLEEKLKRETCDYKQEVQRLAHELEQEKQHQKNYVDLLQKRDQEVERLNNVLEDTATERKGESKEWLHELFKEQQVALAKATEKIEEQKSQLQKLKDMLEQQRNAFVEYEEESESVRECLVNALESLNAPVAPILSQRLNHLHGDTDKKMEMDSKGLQSILNGTDIGINGSGNGKTAKLESIQNKSQSQESTPIEYCDQISSLSNDLELIKLQAMLDELNAQKKEEEQNREAKSDESFEVQSELERLSEILNELEMEAPSTDLMRSMLFYSSPESMKHSNNSPAELQS